MKKTKRSLFASIVVLLLTFCMFVGSTFSWFTDTVTNNGNKIKAGTLDISLSKYNGSSWTDISDDTTPVFSYDKWEPGYSTKALLKVTNNGTLALKYNLKLVLPEEDSSSRYFYTSTINPEINLRGYSWNAGDSIDLNSINSKLESSDPHISIKFTDGTNEYSDMYIFSSMMYYCVRDVEAGTIAFTPAYQDGHWLTEPNDMSKISFLEGSENLESNKILANWLKDNGVIEKSSKLSDVIDVYVKANATTSDYTKTFAQVESDASFTKIGTLTELLNQELFINDAPIVKESVSGTEKVNESLTEIVLHMQEDAGNEYQGLAENFDIRVEATQYTKENDGFNNDQYDKDSLYPSDITDLTGYTWTPDESKINTVDDIRSLFCMDGKAIHTYFVDFKSNNVNFIYIDTFAYDSNEFGYYYAYNNGGVVTPVNIFDSQLPNKWVNKDYLTITFTSNVSKIINGDLVITDVTPKMVSDFANKLMEYGYLTKPSN